MRKDSIKGENNLSTQIVGRVAALYRFPVKSMRGESLSTARVLYTGLEGDRRFGFLRLKNRTRFPWLTGRQVQEMLQYSPEHDDPTHPATSPVWVRTPDGNILPIESEELRLDLEERAGEPVHLLHLGKGAHDSLTLSVLSTSALCTLSGYAGFPLTPERFRPNILVDTGEADGFPEDEWVGGELVFGNRADSAHISVVRPIERCMMINLDPETARQNPNKWERSRLATRSPSYKFFTSHFSPLTFHCPLPTHHFPQLPRPFQNPIRSGALQLWPLTKAA